MTRWRPITFFFPVAFVVGCAHGRPTEPSPPPPLVKAAPSTPSEDPASDADFAPLPPDTTEQFEDVIVPQVVAVATVGELATALDDARDGQTIELAAGTYDVTGIGGLKIEGKVGFILKATGPVELVTTRPDLDIISIVNSERLLLEALAFRHDIGRSKSGASAIHIRDSNMIRMENCDFRGGGAYGVRTGGTRNDEIHIVVCDVHGYTKAGIDLRSTKGSIQGSLFWNNARGDRRRNVVLDDASDISDFDNAFIHGPPEDSRTSDLWD